MKLHRTGDPEQTELHSWTLPAWMKDMWWCSDTRLLYSLWFRLLRHDIDVTKLKVHMAPTATHSHIQAIIHYLDKQWVTSYSWELVIYCHKTFHPPQKTWVIWQLIWSLTLPRCRFSDLLPTKLFMSSISVGCFFSKENSSKFVAAGNKTDKSSDTESKHQSCKTITKSNKTL